MQPKTQQIKSHTAKRYGVRLRSDRVLERAFREVYEQILEQHGKHAAGDYMRSCLLSGHALHSKQSVPPDPKVTALGGVGEGVAIDDIAEPVNTKPNGNDVTSDNESGGSDIGTMVNPVSELGAGVDVAGGGFAVPPPQQPAPGMSLRSSVLRQITGNREPGNLKNEG